MGKGIAMKTPYDHLPLCRRSLPSVAAQSLDGHPDLEAEAAANDVRRSAGVCRSVELVAERPTKPMPNGW